MLVGDAAEYAFFTVPESRVACGLVPAREGQELQLFGNRAGLLSLANIFFWFAANSYRREFLSLGELGFVRLDALLSVVIRLADEIPPDSHGKIERQDRGEQLEWAINEDGLQAVALMINRLVSMPHHEYDRLTMAEHSDCEVHIRMTDIRDWFAKGAY